MINPYIESRHPEEQIVQVLAYLGISQGNVTLLMDNNTAIGYKVHGPDALVLEEYKRVFAEQDGRFV